MEFVNSFRYQVSPRKYLRNLLDKKRNYNALQDCAVIKLVPYVILITTHFENYNL